MRLPDEDVREIRRLEEMLWRPESRFSPAIVTPILAEDFFEFGASGRVHSRDAIIATPARPLDTLLPLPGFTMRALTPDVALTTYRSVVRNADGTETHARRSSVWTREDGRWRILFHQGTPIPADERE